MAERFLPYGRQAIDDADIKAVVEVLRGDWLTTGPAVETFEAAICEATGAKHAIAVNSGTAALHVATMALALCPGDWAVVPAITFAATANAVRYVGGQVEFCDVDPETGLMTPETLAAALDHASKQGRRVRAILPVHLAGQPVDMSAIAEMAAQNGAALVEDACHALGGSYTDADGNAIPIGSHPDAAFAAFSFHPVKAIAVGEGGAVTTGDDHLAARARVARTHGLVRDPARFVDHDLAFDSQGRPNPWYYEIQEIGLNYRLSDINCALGTSQIAKLSRFIATRRKLADAYDNMLHSLANVLHPIPRRGHGLSGWHLYPVLIDFDRLGIPRGEFIRRLAAQGIGSQVHYIPVPWLPAYKGLAGTERSLPGAAAYYRRTLSLPMFASMEVDDVKRVVDALRTVAES